MSELRDKLEDVVVDASLLWDEEPAGTFDVEAASVLVDDLAAWLLARAPNLEPPPPAPDEQAEDPSVIAQREYEMRLARERCAVAVGGHLFYAGRANCARCFEPKPPGWGT